jgi:hypothetical protein
MSESLGGKLLDGCMQRVVHAPSLHIGFTEPQKSLRGGCVPVAKGETHLDIMERLAQKPSRPIIR